MAVKNGFIYLAIAIAYFHVTYATVDLEIQRVFQPYKECEQEGFLCKSCEESVYCARFPDGSLVETSKTPCTNGQTCNDLTGTCSSEPNMNCDLPGGVQFECHQPGIFPDPINCFKYYHCIQDPMGGPQLTLYEGKCGAGYAYDPKTSRCTLKFKTKCPEIVPKCESVGQKGPIPRNPAYYYLCLQKQDTTILYPEIFVCPFNQVYEGNGCVDKYNDGLDANGKCIAAGSFYDPDDCHKYRTCTAAGADPRELKCGSSYTFIPGKGCTLFNCENCWNLI